VAGVGLDQYDRETQQEVDLLEVSLDLPLAAIQRCLLMVEVPVTPPNCPPASARTAAASMLPDTDRTVQEAR
jgi:hypothetical protein